MYLKQKAVLPLYSECPQARAMREMYGREFGAQRKTDFVLFVSVTVLHGHTRLPPCSPYKTASHNRNSQCRLVGGKQ